MTTSLPWLPSLVRIPLGLLLCAAALGKSIWPDLEIVLLGERHGMWLPATLCALQLALAAWVICGIGVTWSCRVALIAFLAFSIWSFDAAMAGKGCSCFGAALPPVTAWVYFAIDLACIGLIILCANDLLFATSASRAANANPALMLLSALIICFGALTTHTMWTNPSAQLLAADQPLPYRSTVLLDPARWIGSTSTCPLLRHIDIGAELADGDWTLVLVSSQCARCDAAIAAIANDVVAQPDSSQGTAFIDVHAPREPRLLSGQFKWGRLMPAHRWLVRVPVKIHLRSGVVVGVSPPG